MNYQGLRQKFEFANAWSGFAGKMTSEPLMSGEQRRGSRWEVVNGTMELWEGKIQINNRKKNNWMTESGGGDNCTHRGNTRI